MQLTFFTLSLDKCATLLADLRQRNLWKTGIDCTDLIEAFASVVIPGNVENNDGWKHYAFEAYSISR